MKLKVFKLKDGKLEYTGIREAREGDAIIEVETPTTETVHLRESDRLDQGEKDIIRQKVRSAILEGFADEKRASEAPARLRAAFKAEHPEWSEKALDIAMRGR